MITVRRLSANATLPTRAPKAVGLDLYSAHTVIIPAHDNALVETDLSVAVPDNTYGRITNKRNLGLKNKVEVYAGIIDGERTGNVGVVLYNHDDASVTIKQGDCIAQLIIERVVMAQVKEGDTVYA
jgi:dUTP pyrophosphatase